MKNEKTEKFEVSGGKNQCCRELGGDHFYILNNEFGGIFFDTPRRNFKIFQAFEELSADM